MPTSSPSLPASVLALALVTASCGASDAEPPAASPHTGSESADTAETDRTDEAPTAETNAEAEADDTPEPPPEPEAPPEPEPAVVEAGQRLGPIRIGMSEDELRALGLPESRPDPRSLRFGPYRVFLEDGAVRRVEAQMGDLERIRFGARTFDVGVDIYALRDAFGDCQWYEGGGERYRCADGTLFVHTTHSLDPARYTIAVERR